MVYDKEIVGKFVTLKSIGIEDAEFSYELRRDPRFVSIMGQPASSLDNQKKYIERQREKEGDYYFVVYNRNKERIGLIGVYDILGESCETGREINVGQPYETMEAEVLLLDFCLEVLKLKVFKSIVYKNNPKQYNMLKRRGGYTISEIIHNGIPAYLLETTFDEQKQRIEKIRVMIDKLENKV